MRESTERGEAVECGAAQLVGTDRRKIVEASTTILAAQGKAAQTRALANPFGDGNASIRIVEALWKYNNSQLFPVRS